MRLWWRPRLDEEFNREVRQFGGHCVPPGEVEHVELRACALHQTDNWLILTGCSNAFDTTNRTTVRIGVATRVPALTSFGAKRYGKKQRNHMVCSLSD